jgi:hypothetical protein
MFFSSRRKRGPDQFLNWKVRLFFAGAALALIGIAMDSSAIVGAATLVLLGGIVLRLWPGGQEEVGEDGGEEESAEVDP